MKLGFRMVLVFFMLAGMFVAFGGAGVGPSGETVNVAAAGECSGPTGDEGPTSGVNFSSACATHDYCYSGAPGLYRSECDNNFWDDMDDICSEIPWWQAPLLQACGNDSGAFYWAVNLYGNTHWGGPCYLNDPYYDYSNGVSCTPDCEPGTNCLMAPEPEGALIRDGVLPRS